MAEKTRRELLAEAFDASMDEEDTGDEVVVTEPLVESPSDDTVAEESSSDGTSAGDTSGAEKQDKAEKSLRKPGLSSTPKSKEVGKKPAPTEEERQEAEAARKDAEGKEGEEGKRQQPVTDKAPNSWKPGVREHWTKIPAEARAEITRREREIQTTLSQTANIRKFAGDFANVINPFSHLIRAQNSTPLQAVQNLMTTAAGLMTGNDQQKAAIVAEIIQNYGINCEELDNILTAVAQKNGGKVPDRRQARREEYVPSWAQPLIEQTNRFKQLEQQHEERLREEADEEISKVESKPYFDDLREDIADIMEISANRGRKMTVLQAYEKAVELNPNIKKLIARTRLSNGQFANNQTLTRARRAASTVAGAPMGKISSGRAGGEKKSRREQLMEAWDDAVDG